MSGTGDGVSFLSRRSVPNLHRQVWYTVAMKIQGHYQRWEVGESVDPAIIRDKSAAWQVAPLVAGVLIKREMQDKAEVDQWLKPSFTHMHDPGLLPGCHAAATRLITAITTGESVVIYGDYDVDGITATTILYHMMYAISPEACVQTYVPHRMDEGYGLNAEAIEKLAGDGAKVIVSVDCGITAVEPACVARAAGVDLIITDHHEMGDELPEAHTLVHPRLTNNGEVSYPFGELCGAGVAYKLAWEMARTHCGSERVSNKLRKLLVDLACFAALGTIADVMPLVDENRALVSAGLARVKDTGFIGLNALIDAAGLREEKVDAYQVGFVLAPRLNAAGRMGHAGQAVKLFTEADASDSARIAGLLNSENQRRQRVEKEIVEQVKARVEAEGLNAPDCRAIVLSDTQWHAGVVGIVCSRIVEAFHRPVTLLQIDGDTAKGSARSIDGFNIVDAFTACSAHLQKYGGHAAAAGLTMSIDEVPAFTEAMKAYALEHIEESDMVGKLKVLMPVNGQALNWVTVSELEKLAPFGVGNARPTFLVRGLEIVQPPKVVGREGKHLVLQLRGDGCMFRCMGWSMGELVRQLKVGMNLDVACRPKLNEWAGRKNVELEIRDLCIQG